MKFLKSITIALLLGVCSSIQAQDIHFSMFDMAPLQLNPTYTGYYSGTFRLGGVYRAQWLNLSVSQDGFDYSNGFSGFQTPNVYLDVPFGIRNKKTGMMKSWMGVGINFSMDQVGSLSNLFASISLAYHLGLGQKGNTIISFGLQGGIGQFRTTSTDFIFENDILFNNGILINSSGNPTNVPTQFGNTSATVPDLSGGLMVSHRGRLIKFQLGASVRHFTTPTYSFLTTQESKMPMTMLANFVMDADFKNSRIRLKPLVFFHNILTPTVGTQGGFSAYELNTQILLGIHFNDMKDITLYIGGGYRWFDAAIARIGLDIKGFKFGFAYDINTNTLSQQAFATDNRGMAFEVALSYVAKIYKVPVVKDILYCPRF